MSDEYEKTVVITDPAYQPGQLRPLPPADAPKDEPKNTAQTSTSTAKKPKFDDSSWLT